MRNATPFSAGPLFTEPELTELETIGTVIHRPSGSMLVADDEATDFALLLLTGHVKVVKGPQRRVVALRGPGEVVGEMVAIIGGRRNASIYAVTDVTIRHIPAEDWIAFLYEHRDAMFKQLFAAELRLAEATVKSVESIFGAEQKLAKALIELTNAGIGEEEAGAVALRFNQRELADIAGISRESVVQVIRHLKAANVVETGRQLTRVLDPTELKAIANGATTVGRT